METTGEKPEAGIYTCDNCGQVVVLDDEVIYLFADHFSNKQSKFSSFT